MADLTPSVGPEQNAPETVQAVPEKEPTVTPIDLPVLPESGQEIYDQIMGGINPELTTSQRETLDEKYKDETPEQKAARLEKYQADFAEYEKQYAEYVKGMNGQVRTFEHNARASMENDDKTDEQSNLDSLISSINSL